MHAVVPSVVPPSKLRLYSALSRSNVTPRFEATYCYQEAFRCRLVATCALLLHLSKPSVQEE